MRPCLCGGFEGWHWFMKQHGWKKAGRVLFIIHLSQYDMSWGFPRLFPAETWDQVSI